MFFVSSGVGPVMLALCEGLLDPVAAAIGVTV